MSNNSNSSTTSNGDSRSNIADDPRVKEAISMQSSAEAQKQMERFRQAMHTKLLPSSLPRQRVHDHATLYLAADAMGHWKEVAAATAEERMKNKRRKQQHQNPPSTPDEAVVPTQSNSNESKLVVGKKISSQQNANNSNEKENHQEEQQGESNSTTNNHTKEYDGDIVVSDVLPAPTSDGADPSSPNQNTTSASIAPSHSSLSIVDASRPSDRVLVINVGGTLGMHPSEKDGRLRPKAGFLLEQMLNLHELRFPEVPVFDFIEYHDLVDSSDLSSTTWETLARDIAEHYDDYSGILVAHGTDTLHYTAAALSFALERLAKPVIVMGSMIPLCELYTDTRRNVTAALRFAGCGSWLSAGVYVFFHEQLFYGTRCVKMNDSLKAFDSPNSAPAADLNTLRFIRSASASVLHGAGTSSRDVRNSDHDQVYSDSFYQSLAATSHVSAPLNLRAKFSDRVLCLGIVPDTVLSEASKLFTAKNNSKYRNNITLPRAIILKVPELNIKGSVRLAASLQSFGAAAAASGCAVFATSSSSLHGLSPSTVATLLRYVPDVVPLNDMLCETACVKAMWLLGEMLYSSRGGRTGAGGSSGGGSMSMEGGGSYGGNFSDHNGMENFKRLMFVNLRGEVTETAKSIPRPVWMSRL